MSKVLLRKGPILVEDIDKPKDFGVDQRKKNTFDLRRCIFRLINYQQVHLYFLAPHRFELESVTFLR